jgi:hypothetical protein
MTTNPVVRIIFVLVLFLYLPFPCPWRVVRVVGAMMLSHPSSSSSGSEEWHELRAMATRILPVVGTTMPPRRRRLRRAARTPRHRLLLCAFSLPPLVWLILT